MTLSNIRIEIEQPRPFDPNMLRYCPQRPFPPYRYLPGLMPHPIRDEEGHSYGQPESDVPFIPPQNWCQNEAYLYGVDLYNYSYWWEAHEAWEAVWNTAPSSSPYAMFMQGLIQIAAAFIKRHMRILPGVRKLSVTGRNKLRYVLESGEVEAGFYMGLDLIEFLARLDLFFAPFFENPISIDVYDRFKVNPLIRLKV